MGGKVSAPTWAKNAEEYGGPETLKVISAYHSVGVDVSWIKHSVFMYHSFVKILNVEQSDSAEDRMCGGALKNLLCLRQP